MERIVNNILKIKERGKQMKDSFNAIFQYDEDEAVEMEIKSGKLFSEKVIGFE